MTLELRKENFVHAFWFVAWGVGDLLAHVVTTPEDGTFAEYRFRYYEDDRTDRSSKDHKSWYRLAAKPGVPSENIASSLCDAMHMLCNLTTTQYNGELTHIELNCDGEEAQQHLLDLPFMHVEEIGNN